MELRAYKTCSEYEAFEQDFNEFRDTWNKRLELYRREMDVQRDPRFKIRSSVGNNQSFNVLEPGDIDR